ncbi:histidinol-phosphate transaminase [Paenibacillaceae bacterium]|nr:histidinol-phosphate transaminase [Paenibacillaceae bacterium]
MSIILPHIAKLTSYPLGSLPPEGSNAIKLNQNESPYPPSPHVLNALCSVGEEALRRYPDEKCSELRAIIANFHGVKDEQVLVGNGSSEIISLIMKVFVGSERMVAAPDPTFGLYCTVSQTYQAQWKSIPTTADFTIDTEALLHSGAHALILVNPNAPTGLLLPLGEIKRIVSQFSGLVVVDEAYIDFAEDGSSAIPLVEEFSNLIILRTLSKAYALCGARVGYGIANTELIGALEKGKDIYNVNAVSRQLAAAALLDRSYTDQTVKAVIQTREAFSAELCQLGFQVWPSQTNFVLCKPPATDNLHEARAWCAALIEHNVYIRHFEHPRLVDKLRISIGTNEEMARLLGLIKEFIGN